MRERERRCHATVFGGENLKRWRLVGSSCPSAAPRSGATYGHGNGYGSGPYGHVGFMLNHDLSCGPIGTDDGDGRSVVSDPIGEMAATNFLSYCEVLP